MSGRAIAFLVLCLVCALGAIAYVQRASRRPATANERMQLPAWRGVLASGPAPADAERLLLFRNTALDGFGVLAVVPLDARDDRRALPAWSCERVDYAAGRGVCLAAERGVLTHYAAVIFDDGFRSIARLPLTGSPSRVRVSPDGRLAGVTMFVQGHSYSDGRFSTLTSIVDLARGEYRIVDLEQLAVSDGGSPLTNVDRNFWGVTFAGDSNRFFATVATGGRTQLIEGSVSDRTATVIATDGECPSVSPDGTRVAFKRRIVDGAQPVRWQLMTMSLATRAALALAEARSVDDQVEWLDDAHILYALPRAASGTAETDTWIVDADGGGAPKLFLPNASSAVVVARGGTTDP